MEVTKGIQIKLIVTATKGSGLKFKEWPLEKGSVKK